MKDTRAQLIEAIAQESGQSRNSATTIANRILERLEVTPKPVVTAEELGRMMRTVMGWGSGDTVRYGSKLLDQLDSAGLVIVRREEVER